MVRRLALAIALALMPVAAHAAIALGVHKSAQCAGASSCTTAAVTSAASSSTFYVVGCTTGTPAATPITDSKSNSYSSIQQWTATFGGVICQRSYKTNGTGGASHTFTMSTTGTATTAIWATEITGADTTNSLDKSAKGNDTVSPYDSPTSGVLTVANELLMGFLIDNSVSGTCTYGAANGFTLVETQTSTSGVTGATEDKIVSVTTADHASFTDTGCGVTSTDVAIDTFKQAGGATRGLFMQNPLTGIGTGGSFFPDPLAMMGVAIGTCVVAIALAVCVSKAEEAIHAVRQTVQKITIARQYQGDSKLAQLMKREQAEAKEREALKVLRRG